MMRFAQEQMARMSPEQIAQIQEQMKNMDPTMMQEAMSQVACLHMIMQGNTLSAPRA